MLPVFRIRIPYGFLGEFRSSVPLSCVRVPHSKVREAGDNRLLGDRLVEPLDDKLMDPFGGVRLLGRCVNKTVRKSHSTASLFPPSVLSRGPGTGQRGEIFRSFFLGGAPELSFDMQFLFVLWGTKIFVWLQIVHNSMTTNDGKSNIMWILGGSPALR